MNRLIFVPQFPVTMRYSEFWISEFPKQFQKYFDEVLVIGKKYTESKIFKKSRGEYEMFSPIEKSIEFECEQIKEYNELKLQDNDILFLSDISFPGLFSNILYHKKPKKCFAFCHATSLNYGDYFEKVSHSKFGIESYNAKMFDKVFVGSDYHLKKLNWKNIIITTLPTPPFETFKENKIYDIISVARPNNQKITKLIEDKIEKEFGKIIRKNVNNWKDYYKFLSQGKVLLITSKEDTFGYSVMEAIINNTIPIAPNKLCFPEILPREYLYDDLDELKDTLTICLGRELEVPKLLCQNKVDDFYKNISQIMKGI